MSEQTSHATQPSESDFHDSHPISDAIKTQTLSSIPSMGDLSVVASEAENNTLNTQSLGDLTQFESMESSRIPNVDNSKSEISTLEISKSEILSDIAILDEAYAELEESNVESSSAIPILSEAITAPTASRIISDDKTSSSIPLLNQEATAFAEMKSGKAETSVIHHTVSFSASTITEVPLELSEAAKDEPLFESSNSDIEQLDSSLEPTVETMSEVLPAIDNTEKSETEQNNVQYDVATTQTEQSTSLITNTEELNTEDDKALEALLTSEMDIPEYDDPNIASSISNLSLGIESVLEVNTTSIDEKIANASSDHESDLELSDFSSSMTNDLSDESLNETSSEISAFNPAVDLDNNSITHTSHSVGILGNDDKQGNQLNLSIPFELHSQLSKKIDELVIDATSSITDELQCQLTSRLDNLLGKAVESILPKLVNQMAIELQHDVNKSIKQNLPSIINDVLNKTRLPH